MRVYISKLIFLIAAAAVIGRAADEPSAGGAEGTSFKLAAIKVDGNKYYSDRRIRDMLALDKGQRYDRYLFDYLLEKGLQAVADAYREEGFADVETRWAFRSVKPESRKLAVLIREGKRTRVEDILIEGVDPSEYLAIRENLGIDVGAPLAASVMGAAATKISRYYADRGYARVKVDVAIDREAKTVTFNVQKGDLYHVDRVLVAGNTTTRPRIVSREVEYYLKPDRLYRASKIDKARARIYGTGLYRDLTLQPVDSEKPGLLDLLAVVREEKRRWYKIEPRYTSPDWGGLTLGWGHNNVMGNNQRFAASMYGDYAFQEHETEYGSDLTYTEPWLFGYRYKGTLTVFYHREVIPRRYWEAGIEPKVAREITERLEATAALKINQVKGNLDDIRVADRPRIIRSIILTCTYDGRSDIFNPLAGSYLYGYEETAGGLLGGDDYWKVIGDARQYIPIGPAGMFGVRIRGGKAAGYGETKYPPAPALFFAGGAYSVRGFGEGELGPWAADGEGPGGAANLLLANAEFRFQLPFTEDKRVPGINLNLGNLWAGLFLDAGDVWNNRDDRRMFPFGYGTGVGIRYNTPVGPLRFDYGWPIMEKGASTSMGRLYFAFGHIF